MDHRIKLYMEKTGILLAVYLLLKYLLPLVFPFFLAWLTVLLLASASRHFHRKLLPFSQPPHSSSPDGFCWSHVKT